MKTTYLVAALVGAVACGGDAGQPQVSGSSHWVRCRSLADCADVPGAVACQQQRCVDATGAPIARPEASPDASGAEAGRGGTTTTGGRGGTASPDAGSTSGTGSGSAGSSGGSGGAAASQSDAGIAACRQSNYAAPALDKSCMTSDDCFVAVHQADCCGTMVALAFNETELAAFDTYEAGCHELVCMCPGMAPTAEDGSPLNAGLGDAIAECVAGTCFGRGAEADDCSGAMECTDPENGNTCVAATGPVGNTYCRGSDGVCQRCRCASPDTPVATPDGERPIASLREGDLVYSIDGAGIRIVPIVRVSRTAALHHQVMRVRLANGRTLEISPGHPTADGRLFADLVETDQLGGEPVLEARLVEYTHAFTHDILPASSTGTYFAAGVPIGSTLY